jgi:FtsP/CotA-like multicopper oxidase with cupredoxin domain
MACGAAGPHTAHHRLGGTHHEDLASRRTEVRWPGRRRHRRPDAAARPFRQRRPPSLLASADFPKRFVNAFQHQTVLTPTDKVVDGVKVAETYDLKAQTGWANILPFKKTPVLGYDGNVPGHRIDVDRGMPVELTMRNGLMDKHPVYDKPVNISTHLHGSASLPQYDGYADDMTEPGQAKVYKYPNDQPARTLWYHDHGAHYTAQNAYSGLAAQYHMHDPLERKLLPTYKRPTPEVPRPAINNYDVAITLSDMMFKADGSQLYDDRSWSGLWGDVILVNGVPWPNMVVEPRVYRFRVLNASISRSYKLTLSPAAKLHMVATDGGLMPRRQEVSSYRHAPAERYEFLIDFAPFRGQKVELRNLSNPNNRDFDFTSKIMQFTVADKNPNLVGPASTLATMPTVLNPNNEVMNVLPNESKRTRRIKVEKNDITNEWELNDTTWHDIQDSDYKQVIANPGLGDVEIWEFENSSGGWFHPLHIHLIDFKILSRNGMAPFPYEQGPKDVVYIGEGETVRLLMKFGPHKGKYMVHCHNLPHEDHDMMNQFSVGLPTKVVDGKIYVTDDYDPNDPIEAAKPWDY